MHLEAVAIIFQGSICVCKIVVSPVHVFLQVSSEGCDADVVQDMRTTMQNCMFRISGMCMCLKGAQAMDVKQKGCM